MVKVLHDVFGVAHGFTATVGAYAGDQMPPGGPHHDLRRARSAGCWIDRTTLRFRQISFRLRLDPRRAMVQVTGDQFGSSGCVGCGRCIVWCPVGIDLTEEVRALPAEREQRGGTGEP